jgi:hypothetical protein
MKNPIFHIIIVLSALLLIVGCQNANGEQKKVQEVAWEHLSKEQQSHVKGFWKNAKVIKLTLNNGVLSGTKYDGKEVYLVDFPSDENPTLGGIGVYISTDTNEFIKLAPRD